MGLLRFGGHSIWIGPIASLPASIRSTSLVATCGTGEGGLGMASEVVATVATVEKRPYQIRRTASRSNDAMNTIRLRSERCWHAAAHGYKRDLRLWIKRYFSPASALRSSGVSAASACATQRYLPLWQGGRWRTPPRTLSHTACMEHERLSTRQTCVLPVVGIGPPQIARAASNV
jgi:hypothetical protein